MLHEAYMDKLSHVINDQQYNLTKTKLNEENELLENKLNNLSFILKQQTEIGEMIFDLVKYGSSIYKVATDEYKRTIINVFFQSMKLKNVNVLCCVNKGFDLLLRDIKLINSSKIDILENFEKKILNLGISLVHVMTRALNMLLVPKYGSLDHLFELSYLNTSNQFTICIPLSNLKFYLISLKLC